MLTILDPPNIRPGAGADPGVELLLNAGILLEHGDEGAAQNASQLALKVRPHVLQGLRDCERIICLITILLNKQGRSNPLAILCKNISGT